MLGEKDSPKKPYGTNCSNNGNIKNKKKKKRGGSKRKLSLEQTVAYKSVSEWVFLDNSANSSSAAEIIDDFGVVHWNHPKERLVFDFHCHSIHSDGFLSPTKLVERAHQNGVRVLLIRSLSVLVILMC